MILWARDLERAWLRVSSLIHVSSAGVTEDSGFTSRGLLLMRLTFQCSLAVHLCSLTLSLSLSLCLQHLTLHVAWTAHSTQVSRKSHFCMILVSKIDEAETASQDLLPELAQCCLCCTLWSKQLNSLPRFRGEGKYTPSLDGGLARSRCRTARRIGDILAFVFGKYDLLYPGSHPGRTAINIL